VAFQERLVYGAKEYGLPKENEELRIPVFSIDASGKINKAGLVMITFDNYWLSSLVSKAGEDSVARMLFDQGDPVQVRVRQKPPGNAPKTPLWTIILNWCTLLLPLFIINSNLFLALIQRGNKDTQLLLRELR